MFRLLLLFLKEFKRHCLLTDLDEMGKLTRFHKVND